MPKFIESCILISLVGLFAFLASISFYGLIDPTQNSKFITFSVTISFVSLSYILLVSLNKKQISVNKADALLLLLLVYLIINRYSFQNAPVYSLVFPEMIGLTFLYVVLRGMPASTQYVLLAAIVLGGFLQVLHGELQLMGGLPSYHKLFRVTGAFFNPGPYAGYLGSVFPIALGLYFIDHKQSDPERKGILISSILKYFSLIVAVFIFLVLPVLQSRAAYIAVSGGVCYLLYHRFDGKKLLQKYLNTKLKMTLAVLIASIVSIIVCAGLYSFKKASADGRLLIWKVSARMIADHPLTGVGFDRFKSCYMNYQAAYFRDHPHTLEIITSNNVTYAFNEPLQFLVEHGFIGVALLTFVILRLSLIHTRDDPYKIIAKCGLITIFIFSLFSYPAQILPIKLNAVLYTVILVKDLPCYYFHRIDKMTFSNTILTVFICLTACFGAFTTLKYITNLDRSLLNWNEARMQYAENLYPQSIEFYSAAYPYQRYNGKFLMQYGKALSLNGQNQKAVKIFSEGVKYENGDIMQISLGNSYTALGQYDLAEKCYKNALAMIPKRFYPEYLLAKLYLQEGQKNKAIAIARNLSVRKVNSESVAVTEMLDEMQMLLRDSAELVTRY